METTACIASAHARANPILNISAEFSSVGQADRFELIVEPKAGRLTFGIEMKTNAAPTGSVHEDIIFLAQQADQPAVLLSFAKTVTTGHEVERRPRNVEVVAQLVSAGQTEDGVRRDRGGFEIEY